MEGQNLNIKQEILEKLKEIIPQCFTEDKIDWEKLRVFFEDNIEFRNERYHLNWAGKTDAIRLLQTPTYKTLKPCREESLNFDETENLFIEGDNLEVLKILQKSYFGKIKMIYIDPPYNTGNDFIYKDNYSETLTEYRKKVGDVDKNGNATKAGLFRNTKENGHYHSNWLNMMYPRLFLARNLLRDDGVIFVSIDDNEVHNLRLLMDEIFGEENFVNIFCWVNNLKGRQISKAGAVKTFEFILCYAKNIENIGTFKIKIDEAKQIMPLVYKGFNYKKNRDQLGDFVFKNELYNSNSFFNEITRPNLVFVIHYNPKTKKVKFSDIDENISYEGFKKIYPPKNNDGVHKYHAWRWSKEKILKELQNLEFIETEKGIKIYTKIREFELTNFKDFINNISTTHGTEEVKKLFKGQIFEYPKPTSLIKILIRSIEKKNNDEDNNNVIILDFFAGSGTTAHAVMELNKEDGSNRRFILVQLPEPTDPESEAYKAGYKTIADIAKERIRRAGNKIKQELQEEAKKKAGQIQFELQEEKKVDTGFKVFKLAESNFKQWRPFRPENAEEIKQAVLDFIENVKPDATTENILYELMLKNGKKLTDNIEKKNGFYVINENELVLLLEEINKEIVDEIIKLKPQKVIALDKIFNGNDQLKTNTVLQFKEADIEFKSV